MSLFKSETVAQLTIEETDVAVPFQIANTKTKAVSWSMSDAGLQFPDGSIQTTAGGAGGSNAFSALTSGVNTLATMQVGAGAVIKPVSSGQIIATNASPSGTAGHFMTWAASGAFADGGVPAPSATIDTTNASNISSGTLLGARLPQPSATTLGGIESYVGVAHQWINTISTSGVPGSSQPAFSDLIGTAAVSQGGTGQTSLTNHGVLIGAGTSGVTQLAAAAAGTVLTGQGASLDPLFSATPTLGVSGTTRGTISFAGNTSGTVTIQPAAAAGTWSLTLPTTAGTANQFLQTDGTGVTTWATGAGGGSGTVNNGTAGQITYYAATGTTVSGNAKLDDGATTANTLTYTGTSGISSPKFSATGSGVGKAQLFDSGGTNSLTLQAPSSVTSYTWTLPTADATGLLHSNGSGTLTLSTVATADVAANAITSAKLAVVNTYRNASIIVGSDDAASALVNSNLGPQGRQVFIPYAATIVEVTVAADAGTPSVQVRKNHGGTTTNLLSGALSTAASGGLACSNTGGTLGLDGATTCTNTLTTTAIAAGDWLELTSGTAGGTAKRMSISITWTVN